MASLNEMFLSVQGEGTYAGAFTYFVRFFGCNLDCPWCDQPTALGTRSHQIHYDQSADEIAQVICSYPTDVQVCFTGGEPAYQHQELVEIMQAIRALDAETTGTRTRRLLTMETNGTIFVKEFAEELGTFVSLSPKSNNVVINGRQEMHGQGEISRWIKSGVRMHLKFVVEHVQHFQGILQWLDYHVPAEFRGGIPLFFQPEWYQRAKFKEILKLCTSDRERLSGLFGMGFKDVRFVAQQHKDLNVR